MHYFNGIRNYREHIPPGDVTLEYICGALFAWLGIKESPKANRQITDQAMKEQIEKTRLSAGKITRTEKEAWIAADYPNLKKWLPQYRKGKDNGTR